VLISNQPRGQGDNRSQPSNRLGELLIAAGILQADRLSEALTLAQKTGSQIGQVLVMFGCVSQSELEAALQIQQLIRRSSIAPDFGVQMLHESAGGRPIAEILAQAGHSREYIIRNELGELFLAAGMLTQPALAEAIRTSTQVGMPLGKYLALTGVITSPVLFEALNLQVAIRDKKMSKEQAVFRLKETLIRRTAIGTSVAAPPPAPQRQELRLGELLTMAQIISESDVLHAIELGLFNNQPIGKVLVEAKLIPDSLINPALELQNLVKKGELRPAQAAEVLMYIRQHGVSITQAVQGLGLGRKTVDGWKEALDLLKAAGLLSEANFRDVVALCQKNRNDIGRAITDCQLIDELLFQSAVRCVLLVRQQKLQQPQAVIALHYCLRSRSNLDEALQDLSFS
jgi:hypothetical protein